MLKKNGFGKSMKYSYLCKYVIFMAFSFFFNCTRVLEPKEGPWIFNYNKTEYYISLGDTLNNPIEGINYTENEVQVNCLECPNNFRILGHKFYWIPDSEAVGRNTIKVEMCHCSDVCDTVWFDIGVLHQCKQNRDSLKFMNGMVLIKSKGYSLRWGEPVPGYVYNDACVSFTYDFWMDTIEVTQAEFKEVMGYNPSYYRHSLSPVNLLSWTEAMLFCNEKSKKEHFDTIYSYELAIDTFGNNIYQNIYIDYNMTGYRMPTSSEWQYACRSGMKTWYYWGNDTSENVVKKYEWYNRNADERYWSEPHASWEGPQICGQLSPNGYGLYDMFGNVAEFINDYFFEECYTFREISPIDYTGPASGTERSTVGGSFYTDISCFKYFDSNVGGGPSTGFRCVLKVE